MWCSIAEIVRLPKYLDGPRNGDLESSLELSMISVDLDPLNDTTNVRFIRVGIHEHMSRCDWIERKIVRLFIALRGNRAMSV